MFLAGDDKKYVIAYFPRTVSLYEGSDVRILGVPVGKVETVEPAGTKVEVKFYYDAEVQGAGRRQGRRSSRRRSSVTASCSSPRRTRAAT